MQVVGPKSGAIDNNLPKAPEVKQDETKKVFDDIESSTEIPVSKASEEAVKESSLPGVDDNNSNMLTKTKIHSEEYSAEELVITPEEKAAFIDSMITGERYRQEYFIFGGRIKVVIRNRTISETQAMYSYIRYMVSKGEGNVSLLDGDMSYVLLVAQVEEINGTKYSEMKTPLTFTGSAEGDKAPGWMDDLAIWKAKPEGLINAIINRIQLFEYKYWTMVSEASNKNFWNSDTSTEESKTLSERR